MLLCLSLGASRQVQLNSVGLLYRLALSCFLVTCQVACTFCYFHTLQTYALWRLLQDRQLHVTLFARYRAQALLVAAFRFLQQRILFFATWASDGMARGAFLHLWNF